MQVCSFFLILLFFFFFCKEDSVSGYRRTKKKNKKFKIDNKTYSFEGTFICGKTASIRARALAHSTARRDAFRVVLTVRSGVEWVMGLGHISVAGHATSGGASRIRHHPPSRKTQSRPRSAQNTCGVTDLCVSHSIHPDPRKRKITIK